MADVGDSSWTIRPFDGVGPICFSQTRSEVLGLLGTPSRTFKKVPFATTDADAFNAIGLHIYYDPAYCVESVDAISPSTISLGKIAFLQRRVEDVLKEMAGCGYTQELLTFNDLGISLFEERGIVSCVTVFPRGCFDLSNPDSPMSRAKAAAAAWRRR